MSKKIEFGAKPTGKTLPPSSEQWIQSRAAQDVEPMQRLTIDIPKSWHRIIKSKLGAQGEKLSDEVRRMLAKEFDLPEYDFKQKTSKSEKS